jgi:RecB family endonuclease NucS
MLLEIKKTAIRISDKAFFSSKSEQGLQAMIADNPSLVRDDWASAVGSAIKNMDDFQLKNCGANLVGMLIPVIEVRAEQRKAEARQARMEAASSAVGHAAFLETQKELLVKRAEEDEIAARVASNPDLLFGG